MGSGMDQNGLVSPGTLQTPRLPARVAGWCALVLALAGQAVALDPTLRITQYSLRTWSDELPQQTIHSIVQTRDGYLWFGTYEGVVRFDGVRFTVFDSHRQEGVPGTAVVHLHEERGGELWLSVYGGLALYSGGRFTSYSVQHGLPSDVVTAAQRDRSGMLWVGTDLGLCRLRDSSFERVDDPEGPGAQAIRALAEDDSGGLWVGTDDGLYLWREGRFRHFTVADGLPDPVCRVLAIGRDGGLWIGTRNGLVRWGGRRFEVLTKRDGLPSNVVSALFEDRGGCLWIGTEERGLVRLWQGQFSVLGTADGLTHHHVRSIYEDREGNLWVGTNGGLNQLTSGKFTVYTTSEGLSGNFVRTVFEDREGAIWIGIDGGGLNRLAGGQLTVFTAADGLVDSSVRAIGQGSDGTLWIGTRGGLSRLSHGRFSSLTAEDGLSSNLIRAILCDRDDNVWIGTEGGGLNRWHEGALTVLTSADGLAGDDVRALFQDSRGRLWIGSFNGMTCLDQGELTTYTVADGLSNDIVFVFWEDELGNLWIGTDVGLNLLRGDRFTTYDTSVGLVENKIFCILPDHLGNLWLSSNRGLTRVALSELYAFADGAAERVQATGYDTSDGMRTKQCNGTSQPAGWRSRDGHLWFPTAHGVLEVDPGNLRRNETPPPVLVEAMMVDQEPVTPSDGLVLGPGSDSFELHYTALSFSAPEKVHFRYRLEGFERRWMEAGTRRTAYYTNLPPGHYRFRVTACNNDGVWNEEGSALAFELLAPPWQTWWAYLLYVVVAVAVVFGGVYLRLRTLESRTRMLEARVAERTAELAEKIHQLEVSEQSALESERRALEANRAKSVFLSNMSHELRTPLNSIIGFANILIERLEGKIEGRFHGFLSNILGSGQHLLGLINDLLDLAKIEAGQMSLSIETFNLRDSVEGIRSLMRGVADRKGIVVQSDIPADLPPLTADSSKLKQILFNLLSNAVKFSPDHSQVWVRASLETADCSPLGVESIRLDVVDNGIGIAPEHHQLIFEEFRQVDTRTGREFQGTGLGLSLVRSMVAIQGGVVRVASELGQGSTFSVWLPREVVPVPQRERR